MGRRGLTSTQKAALTLAFRRTGNASAAAREVGVSVDQAHRFFKTLSQTASGLPRGPTLVEQVEQLECEIERDLEQLARKVRQLRTLRTMCSRTHP